MANIINVIILGDISILNILSDNLNGFDELNVIGTASNISEAKRLISGFVKPVLIYAVNDSEYNQIENFLVYLNGENIKSIFICRNAAEGFHMLKMGATEMVVKIDLDSRTSNRFAFSALLIKIKHVNDLYSMNDERTLKNVYSEPFSKIIGIGSSTGGTETVQRIITAMPANSPPILVVQHMPPVFTKLFAERLHSICQMSVWEAKDGDELKRGLVLIAPGDYHATLFKRNGKYYVNCQKGTKVNGHCPSVDVMFESLSNVAGNSSIGVILTGMGADGAAGLLMMRNKGAFTIGQDEESSIVYGMPKVAFDIGAVTRQACDSDIAKIILENA